MVSAYYANSSEWEETGDSKDVALSYRTSDSCRYMEHMPVGKWSRGDTLGIAVLKQNSASIVIGAKNRPKQSHVLHTWLYSRQ